MKSNSTSKENLYKRLSELSGINRSTTNNQISPLSNSTLINHTRAANGNALGIIKENHNYFIKTSTNQNPNLGVEDFCYIGGVENKHNYSYRSLAEAEKNRNFYITTINESFNNKKINIISPNPSKKIIKENEALITADSEIQDSDFIANKTGKDNAQAPVNDTNAKTKANDGKGQPSDLVTSDSEIQDSDFIANKTGKDNAQAPINDTNAKSKADSGNSQPSPLVTADSEISVNPKTVKIDETKVIATADSKIKKSDSMTEKKGKESPQQPVNDSNAKSKADKGNSQPSPITTADSERTIKKIKVGHIKENFGDEEPEAAAAPSPAPAPAPSPVPAAPEGGAESELDAASQVIDDLGTDAPEASAAPLPGAQAPDAAPVAATDPAAQAAPADDATIKDIEKLVGKTTQKVRSTELTPEMSAGFLKSFITSFGEKLADIDSEKRKELANMLINAETEEEIDGGGSASAPVAGGEDDVVNAIGGGSDDEQEIEEAIDQHLAELSGSLGDESTGVPSFKSHMSQRGYDPEKVDAISMMEMVSLMSGYANENEGNLNESDIAGIAEYMTPEISEKMNEVGFTAFNECMEPFKEKIKENKVKLRYGNRPIVSLNESDEFGGEEEEEEVTDDSASKDASPFAKSDAMDITASSSDDSVDTELSTDDKSGVNKPAPSFSSGADNMGIGVAGGSSLKLDTNAAGGGSKSVTVDLKNDTINFSLNENEKKIKKIIQVKLQEQLGLTKPTLSENQKSDFSKKLDKMISEAIAVKRKKLATKIAK